MVDGASTNGTRVTAMAQMLHRMYHLVKVGWFYLLTLLASLLMELWHILQLTGVADPGRVSTAAPGSRPARYQFEDIEVPVPVQHTSIRSRQTEPSPSPAPAFPDGGDNLDSFAKEILAAHNAARAARGANALTWSDTIASQAKSWAEKCVWVRQHQFCFVLSIAESIDSPAPRRRRWSRAEPCRS